MYNIVRSLRITDHGRSRSPNDDGDDNDGNGEGDGDGGPWDAFSAITKNAASWFQLKAASLVAGSKVLCHDDPEVSAFAPTDKSFAPDGCNS
jgi:hypothetical protein